MANADSGQHALRRGDGAERCVTCNQPLGLAEGEEGVMSLRKNSRDVQGKGGTPPRTPQQGRWNDIGGGGGRQTDGQAVILQGCLPPPLL